MILYATQNDDVSGKEKRFTRLPLRLSERFSKQKAGSFCTRQDTQVLNADDVPAQNLLKL